MLREVISSIVLLRIWEEEAADMTGRHNDHLKK